jgi:hypothetical protein
VADTLHTGLGVTTKHVVIATDPDRVPVAVGPVMSTTKAIEVSNRLTARGFTVTGIAALHPLPDLTALEKGATAQLPTHHHGRPVRDVNLPSTTA